MNAPATAPVVLEPDELRRYARHLVLPDVGEEGQRRLKAARVVCVGAGGLGSPVALYLAAAGVGRLGLIDDDRVDLTNLQRQVLYGTDDVGRPKLEAARERIEAANPHVEVVAHAERLDRHNALDLLEPWDLVVDGTDNFPTRYLVNDACVLLGKPNVYGSVFRWEGQVSLFAAPEGWSADFPAAGAAASPAGTVPDRGPCYRCLFREPPAPELVQDCAEGGVMGVLPGVVGALQATEAIKWIVRRGRPLVGRLQIFDALATRWREVSLRRDPDCPVCGDAPTQEGLIDYEVFCGLAPGGGSGTDADELGAAELAAWLEREGRGGGAAGADAAGDAQRPFLLDVREPWEWRLGNLERHGAVHVPLGALPERLDEVPEDRPVVVYCRSGGRSGRAVELLREAGRRDVRNLRGGLAAWAAQVDPEVEVG